MIRFNSSRDFEQIRVLGRKFPERQAAIEAYERPTQKPFDHMMIELDVRSSETLN